MPAYNLLDEPWLNGVGAGGVTSVSITTLFEQSHTLASIATILPASRAAIFRHVILAGYLDMAGAPRSEAEWKKRWDAGRLDPDMIHTWATSVHDRFDLFDANAPFAQAAGLESAAGDSRPMAVLDPREATGNNVPLFSARTEAEARSYSYTTAAELLLHALAFDPAGIKTGAVGDPNVQRGKLYGNPTGPLGQLGVVIPLGRTLFETTLLNTPVIPDGLDRADKPHWRRPPINSTWETREPVGIVDWLTWLGRRIRLIPATDSDERTIREVIITGGDRWTPLDPTFEPHSAWSIIKVSKPDDPPLRPKRHRSDKTSWQGLPGLLALEGESASGSIKPPKIVKSLGELFADNALPATFPLSALLTGYEYGSQSAVFENLVIDEIPVPVATLRSDGHVGETVRAIIASADAMIYAINSLDADLRRAAGGDPTPWNHGQRPGLELTRMFDPIVRRILSGLSAEPHRYLDAEKAWIELATRACRSLADRLIAASPPDAHVGRTVTVNNKGRTYRVATAALTFEWRLTNARDANFPELMTARAKETPV